MVSLPPFFSPKKSSKAAHKGRQIPRAGDILEKSLILSFMDLAFYITTQKANGNIGKGSGSQSLSWRPDLVELVTLTPQPSRLVTSSFFRFSAACLSRFPSLLFQRTNFCTDLCPQATARSFSRIASSQLDQHYSDRAAMKDAAVPDGLATSQIRSEDR